MKMGPVVLQPGERWARSVRPPNGCPSFAQLLLFVNGIAARRLEPDWVHLRCTSGGVSVQPGAMTCALLAAALARLGPPGRLLQLASAVSSKVAVLQRFAAGVSRKFVVARIAPGS